MKAFALTTAALIGGLTIVASPIRDTLAAPARWAQVGNLDQVGQQDGKIVIVRRPPPARRIETRSHRPSVRHVWVDGHWQYHRKRFVWVKGYWIVPPRRGAIYVRPKWHRHGGGYVYVRGAWR